MNQRIKNSDLGRNFRIKKKNRKKTTAHPIQYLSPGITSARAAQGMLQDKIMYQCIDIGISKYSTQGCSIGIGHKNVVLSLVNTQNYFFKDCFFIGQQ